MNKQNSTIPIFSCWKPKIGLLSFLTVFMLLLVTTAFAQKKRNARYIVKPEKIAMDQNWEMQSSTLVTVPDAEVSDVDFQSQGWYRAEVPGSVLGSLVDDGAYKDIFFGRNLEKIPAARFEKPWWYRTTFDIDTLVQDKVVRLKLNGISYRADIWVNGHLVASNDTLKGSFRQFMLDITPYLKQGENILAAKVYRAEKGDLNIGFVDWNPEPADHNMGIWRNVEMLISGPISIDDPFVTTTNLDTVNYRSADLTILADLQNHSDKAITGTLTGNIGKDIRFTRKMTLQPGEIQKLKLGPDEVRDLRVKFPNLWWVHTMGQPNLHDLKLQFLIGQEPSDVSSTRFGIRTVSTYLTEDGHRGFRLNGKKILIKGGGWTDPMLLNATKDYEKAGIDYALQMNLNAIRMEGFWGKDQYLYDMCDEKGLLIMAGFSCQWEWAHLIGTKEDKYNAFPLPEQNDIAVASLQSQLLWLRNHPSIFTWLYGSDKWPRPELEKRYLKVLNEVDPTRPAVSSAKEVHSEITGPSAVKMRGPYDYVPPDYWYIDTSYGGAFGFNTETGPGPQIPVLESLEKMIPKDSLWPIGSAWLYHAARGKFHNFDYYNAAMNGRLGDATDLNDYLRKAQYLNYEGMRAMYEAFESNRGKATGIIQWMYNASWPKLWWQLYDYYLMPTGAFYGARKANEPAHISYNYGSNSVELMNNSGADINNLRAEIKVYNDQLQLLWQMTFNNEFAMPLTTKNLIAIPNNLKLSKTWFLDLRLKDAKGKVVSSNFYALSTQKDVLDEQKSTWYVTPQKQFADLTLLEQLPQVTLDKKVEISENNGDTHVKVTIRNPSNQLAFMVHLDMKKDRDGKSVVPVFWDDNYVTLLPKEVRTIEGYCHTKDLAGQAVRVDLDGWNVE